MPTKPSTWPGLGVGSRWSLKLFAEYRWVTWVSKFVGRLIMLIAPKGHFFGQIPQPIHRLSEIKAIFDSAVTSIHSLPVRTTGQDFLHSCRHFFGLHLSLLTMAILLWLLVLVVHPTIHHCWLLPGELVRHLGKTLVWLLLGGIETGLVWAVLMALGYPEISLSDRMQHNKKAVEHKINLTKLWLWNFAPP